MAFLGRIEKEKARSGELYAQAEEILHCIYGPDAAFREGQFQAIQSVMTQSRTLVVQRTGWGKSLVYFVCTRLLRQQGRGVTMVVSPLLVLMKNQMEAAEKIGLRCDCLNSTVRERREEILEALERDELDLLLVTPESLFTNELQRRLPNIRIGLFVVDEAHCISDWGHDFRLEYGRLDTVIRQLPEHVPILATTATANDRVVEDLRRQLGSKVAVCRGPLTRESLSIQVLNMPDRVCRYAWILQNLPRLPGSGIIYCLTQRDCDYLADFLMKNGIRAAAYYSRGSQEGELLNRRIEEDFRKNRIKAIVATVKLGMGYDKPDIAFVIHYQMPGNIVSYYQQIGRAGRSIPRAYIFLMYGKEDEDILNYFIGTAIPSQRETEQIVSFLGSRDGATLNQIAAEVNARRARITKALEFLLKDGFLRKDGSMYYLTPKRFVYNRRHYEQITQIRKKEMEQMKRLAQTRLCYSRYIVSCLDDPSARDCGCCANCLGRPLLPEQASEGYLRRAAEYVDGLRIPILPRKMWEASQVTNRSKIKYINEPGFCICRYGDPGYGELIKRGKYSPERRFCDELVGKSAKMLKPFIQEQGIGFVCFVPSVRSDLVKDFAQRLAGALGIGFLDILEKIDCPQQKEMENSAHQCANAFASYRMKEGFLVPRKLLLVDDMVDSRWTLTVCGYRLMEAGAEKVYPFALADSSNRED